MPLKISRYLVSTCAFGVLALSSQMPALAQAATTAPADVENAQPSEADIVVTARRRAESLQSVPVAITAFSQKMLQEKSISNAFDLNKAVPGLTTSADSGTSTLPSFSIRGRGQFFGAASGSVETYFADVPLSAPFQVPSLPPQFFDLASIQVLKGPQGTLFGRNSTGGAVLFVPAPASLDGIEGYARVQVGNYRNLQVEAAVNLPLTDKIALRVAGYEWTRRGYSRTIGGATDGYGHVLPSQRYDNQDITEFRATLLVQPTEGITNSTIFTYHTDKNRGTPQLLFFKGPGGVPIPLTGQAANPRVLDTDVDLTRPPSNTFGVINTTTIEIADWITMKNIFGYINAEGWGNNPSDADGSALAAVDVVRPPRYLHNRQYTNEVQFQGSLLSDKLDYIVGGLLDLTRQPGARDTINIATMSYPASSPTVPLGYDEQYRQSRFTSKSVFGSLTYHFTNAISATAGVRRSYDNIQEKTLEYVTALPDLVANLALPFETKQVKFKGWSYNAGLEWRIDQDSMVYGGYRRGFKRGGFNARPPSADTALFGPEKVDNFYVGLKKGLNFLGMPGHFNIEGFWDIYKGAQRSYLTLVANGQTVALATVVNNAEKSTYRGFDADFVIDPAHWLSLSGNYTFVDAYYNKYTDVSLTNPAQLALLADPSTDLSVNPVGLVSKHKLSATARFHTELGDGSEIAFAPTISYQSRFYFNDQSFRQPNSAALLFLGGQQLNAASFGANYAPGYKLADARIEWNRIGGSKFDLAANVNNIFDKTFKTGGTGIYVFGFEEASFGPPRMVTVEARVHF
ncbi:TonB-dependent receptor (plasmid) [Sphingomonas paeninsulae]|uniref:TonB-dependent receptor n=1 Tax=Sphingomonas paeninsulae TaxID=2319844 RepID=A0A494TJS4_SPHPE|nr:TonB-dependent receptor [Sphingomonas paeninsulae]AYJ85375.1 TonB-dependent receptor [Sphingomonas paeninsulae]